jgi:DNA mismatch endonuclease (patch repair protein)
MPDVFSKAKRSEVMSRIRSRGNKDTEVALAKLFRRHKITGWRRQLKLRVTSGKRRVTRKARVSGLSPVTRHLSLSVRPDFIFQKIRLALFVDGCFWHGCPKHGTQPKGNRAFWKNKFARNRARDFLVTRALRRANWRVLRVWEHELVRKDEIRLLRRIRRALAGGMAKIR